MNNQELTKLEFILTLENNIICQRFFNVKNYNPKAKNSMNLHDYVKEISDEISKDLKIKTLDFLHENRDYFYGLDELVNKENEEKENFLIKIKLGDEVFIQRIFSANIYHPKVRYTVDIRPNLKRYLSDLTTIFSSQELEMNYLNYEL